MKFDAKLAASRAANERIAAQQWGRWAPSSEKIAVSPTAPSGTTVALTEAMGTLGALKPARRLIVEPQQERTEHV